MQQETAKSMWHAFSFHDQTCKMAEIGERKEGHRRLLRIDLKNIKIPRNARL